MSSAIPTSADQDALLRAGIDRSLRHPVMFFMTSGAAWLAVSIILGIISSAKVHSPEFLSGCAWLTYGRVFPAHVNAFVFGWGFQAAFAVIIWMMARLSRKECTAAGIILTAGHVWNLGVSFGIVGILSGNGTGMSWMEFPAFTWPVLLVSYFAIVIWSFIQFRVRPEGHVYVSQWYLLGAMVWFPWIFITVNTLLHCLPGHPVMAAGINAWYKSSLIFLFFMPVAVGTAYYLAPKVTGRSVYSYSLAKLGFWSLAIIAPWAGMQKLAGAPIPYFLPYVGAAATALMFVPAISSGINLLRTMLTSPETMAASPSLRFTTAGIVGLLITGFAGVVLNLPESTLPLSQFSMSGYGFEILALYGYFSFVMFGAIYFIVPRVTRREWLSRRLIKIHFLFSVYGVITVALVALFGGLQQGIGQEDWKLPWEGAATRAFPYAVATTIAWCFILFSNVFFFIHLTLMWLRLGRRSSHPTLLASGHGHGVSPHGEEGDIDNAGPGHVGAHRRGSHRFQISYFSIMSFRTFILGLSASFGVAWLAIVVVPFIKMRNLAPIELNEATDGTTGVFFPKRTGRVADGALVYAENGCYLCHTQVIRPTYAGNDLYRVDWGGLKADPDRGDTRRETNAYDFFGEKFAQIGMSRMGPDLSNLGRRVETQYAVGKDPSAWLFGHLYNPRLEPKRWKSTCPSYRFMFDERVVKGNPSNEALPVKSAEGTQVVPNSDARALVSYLLSLKKDQPVPAALNFGPPKKKG